MILFFALIGLYATANWLYKVFTYRTPRVSRTPWTDLLEAEKTTGMTSAGDDFLNDLIGYKR